MDAQSSTRNPNPVNTERENRSYTNFKIIYFSLSVLSFFALLFSLFNVVFAPFFLSVGHYACGFLDSSSSRFFLTGF